MARVTPFLCDKRLSINRDLLSLPNCLGGLILVIHLCFNIDRLLWWLLLLLIRWEFSNWCFNRTARLKKELKKTIVQESPILLMTVMIYSQLFANDWYQSIDGHCQWKEGLFLVINSVPLGTWFRSWLYLWQVSVEVLFSLPCWYLHWHV